MFLAATAAVKAAVSAVSLEKMQAQLWWQERLQAQYFDTDVVGSEAHSPSSFKLQGWFNTFSVEDSKKFCDANDHLI
jgi:hypothetical protein